MGHPQIPSSAPHLYSQAVQLKLYQAFIFSIPILFSIILFLLFYLFYLKRRSYTSSPPSPSSLPTTFNQQTLPSSHLCETGVKGSLQDKLLLVLFDEELKMKDSQCCVCLGEFEIQEELHQIPSCRHVFHIDCISHWLHSNSTCPLCRGSINPSTKETHSDPPAGSAPVTRPHLDPQIISPQLEEQLVRVDSNLASCSREQHVILIEGSSSTSTQEVFR